ncbi:MAG TPA: hypothetical protein VKU01_31190 [Bryobacteraceae bacterium]|nr:hypothetical protein [Bryobacteraceae bacterium]
MIPGLPPEGVEAMLATFDTLVGMAGPTGRADGARILREVSAQCSDGVVRDRLLRAAATVEAGEVSAVVPAVAQGITMEQWQAQGGDPVWVEPESAVAGEEEDQEDEGPEDEDEYMEMEPPPLPPLSLSQYFSGLVLRARQDFTDLGGRTICKGRLLRVFGCEQAEKGFRLSFLNERSLVVESGELFSPVPSVGCLFSAWELIDRRLGEFDEELSIDDDERLDEIIADVDDCGEWLQVEGPRPAAPECSSGPLVARVFRRDRDLAAWIRFLFAGVAKM